MFQMLKNLFQQQPSVDFAELVQNGAVLLDVRTKAEFQSGHIKGAINIPLQSLGREVKRIKKMNKPVITHCASGMRSGKALGVLKAHDIEAYNGGGWRSLQQKIK